ncbi:helix-turn-helix domain-containing protein [Paenibacillus hodogayensis]|uniref:Helix-turn-helix domain-containing protein n=1 Tax=Paenibacillus hodogayensis TaxID=279208 RepID=A0ABV5VYZ5_9BACL
MKLLTKMNSVFYRLFLSYAVLLLVTTIVIGATSYVFFTSSLNAEVEKVHARMLSHTADQLSGNLLGRAQKIYLEMATRPDILYFYNNPIAGNYAKMKTIADDLKGIVAMYPDTVDSVAVYFRDDKTILSSLQGVAFLNSVPDKIAASTDWIERMDRAGSPALWIETRSVPVNVRSTDGGTRLVTFVGTYPYNSTADTAKGYFAVNLKAEAFSGTIRSNDETDRGRQWIIDGAGQVIAYGNERTDGIAGGGDVALLQEIGAAGPGRGSLNRMLGGTEYLLTYTTLPDNGWRLIQATPVNEYNKNATAIQRTLLLICLAAVVIGLLLSQVLTFNMYSPLKTLLRKVRGMFEPAETNDQQSSRHENEYKLLDRIVAGVSLKMGELEMTVQENVPIIRHHLVSGLLNRNIASAGELEERLRLLGMSWPERWACAVIVRLDETGMEGLSVEDEQIILYNLVRELEQTGNIPLQCTAVTSSSREITAIAHADDRDERLLGTLVEKLFAYAAGHFRISLEAAWGDWVEDPLRLHESYAEAQAGLKYRYFMPERRFFPFSLSSARERSREELPEQLTESFAEALRARNADAVAASVSELVGRMEKDGLSAEYCHEVWKQWMNAYRMYVKEMNLKSSDVIAGESLERFQRIADIRQFRVWLLDAVEQTFLFVEERGKNRGSESVERVKTFVEANLAHDLSLQIVSERVHLHPRYFSQLFKEETGINFVDYVNKRRLEAAAQLIKTTDLTVERIAASVGFNTPAYFIKKFKEAYGVTPKTYKVNYTSSQP